MKISSLNYISRLSILIFGFLLSSELISSENAEYEIYEKMVSVYRNIDTYSDKGIIKTKKTRRKYIEVMKFGTKYDSNGYFTFDWSDVGGAFDGELNYIKSEKDNIETKLYGAKRNEKNLTSALRSLAGVTRSASYFIPRYLLPEVPILNLSAVYHISLDKIYKHHKNYKYLLIVEYTYGGIKKIWLNADYLIVKLETSIKRMDGVIVNKEISVTPKVKFKIK